MWTEAKIKGHAAEVFEPAVKNPHGFVAIYLHGVHLAKLNGNAAFEQELARHGLPCVAPFTGRSWWTDKICPEFDSAMTAERYVLDHVVPFIAERWDARPPRIALLGTSMGGQGGLRFAFKHPNTFPIVAALSPAIDYQLRFKTAEGDMLREMYAEAESARQDTATLHVHPLNWPRNIWFSCDPADQPWHDSADRLRMKLSALGIPHECDLETSAGGHGWSYYNHMAPRAIGFIAERLERERLRV